MNTYHFISGRKGHTRESGFTLIELVVSIGLFAIVMMLATGAYLVMIGVNRQAQGLATGINNLSFALEVMSLNIKTGTGYACGGIGDCPSGDQGQGFSFIATDGTPTTYHLNGTSISEVLNNDGQEIPLTDPNVAISQLVFYTWGSTRGDSVQPHVTMIVQGSVAVGPNKTIPFTIETGVSMRGTDL